MENALMKYLTKILLTVLLAITPLAATSQIMANQKNFKMSVMLPCDTYENVTAMLVEKHSEIGVGKGKGVVQLMTGQFLPGRMEIWVNPDLISFTIIFTNDQLACIVVNGTDFKPMPTGPSI
jgi:hypothetical protein|tara:strand:+ start:1293 stop:1658 length:366 start_codon:yes stop_codon:yes gene_type:complete